MTTNNNQDLRAIEVVNPSFEELKTQFQQLPLEQQKEFLRDVTKTGTGNRERLTVLLNGNVEQADMVLQFNNVSPDLVERFLEAVADQMRKH